MTFRSLTLALALCTLSLASAGSCLHAQDDRAAIKNAPDVPVIADEPKVIDPATLMPKPLAVKATVDLRESSLQELVEWLRKEQKLTVLVDGNGLNDAGVVLGDPVSDALSDDPVYLLLDRLGSSGLGWYYEDEIVHITSLKVARNRLVTGTYNLGDLLDAGYKSEELIDVIEMTVSPDSWMMNGGEGNVEFVGDVMFVRQTASILREVQGFLAALRKHGRQTFSYDPPEHLALREKLASKLTVNFVDTPLADAVAFIANAADADVRLDLDALRKLRVRERQPITLSLEKRKLETVLRAMIMEYRLTWILRDGILWITSEGVAAEARKTAVYDVRDLCRNDDEANALQGAILSQVAGDELGAGDESVEFPRPGVMAVNAVETFHEEVLNLLERYRVSLRASKPRDNSEKEGKVVSTVYYRMHTVVAEGLIRVLPQLVEPESWKSQENPKAVGQILMVASSPELESVTTSTAGKGKGAEGQLVQSELTSRSVLIITQTRAVHDKIEAVISRVQNGDAMQGGQGGFGGGGFGGGFFSVSPTN